MLNYQKAILILSWVQSSTINICIYVKLLFPDVQADFRKGKGTRDQIANISWIIKKARKCQKNTYLFFIDYAKALDCVNHNKLENSERWEYQTTWPASWETCMQVWRQQLELDIEQQTGSKQERSMSRLYIVTLLI